MSAFRSFSILMNISLNFGLLACILLLLCIAMLSASITNSISFSFSLYISLILFVRDCTYTLYQTFLSLYSICLFQRVKVAPPQGACPEDARPLLRPATFLGLLGRCL